MGRRAPETEAGAGTRTRAEQLPAAKDEGQRPALHRARHMLDVKPRGRRHRKMTPCRRGSLRMQPAATRTGQPAPPASAVHARLARQGTSTARPAGGAFGRPTQKSTRELLKYWATVHRGKGRCQISEIREETGSAMS